MLTSFIFVVLLFSCVRTVKSNSKYDELNCFEHVTSESTSSFKAGEVWRVCLNVPLPGDSDAVDAVAVRMAESSIDQMSEYDKSLLRQPQPRLLQSSGHIIIHVDETEDSPANTVPCEPSSPSPGSHCMLRVHSLIVT